MVEFVCPHYQYHDGYHSSAEERTKFAVYNIKQGMNRVKCDMSIRHEPEPVGKYLQLGEAAREPETDDDTLQEVDIVGRRGIRKVNVGREKRSKKSTVIPAEQSAEPQESDGEVVDAKE